MAKRINEKKLKRLDRYYMIAKVFLMVTPFIAVSDDAFNYFARSAEQ